MNTKQNKRERKLHSSTPWPLERLRLSSQSSTGWSPHHILCRKKTMHWVTNQTVNHTHSDTQRCHPASVPNIIADTSTEMPLPTTRSSNNRLEMIVDIQTGKQYSSTGSINAQKHLNLELSSDISENTHCLPKTKNTDPPRGRSSNCSDLLFKGQLRANNDIQDLQFRDHLHNRTINNEIRELVLNRTGNEK